MLHHKSDLANDLMLDKTLVRMAFPSCPTLNPFPRRTQCQLANLRDTGLRGGHDDDLIVAVMMQHSAHLVLTRNSNHLDFSVFAA